VVCYRQQLLQSSGERCARWPPGAERFFALTRVFSCGRSVLGGERGGQGGIEGWEPFAQGCWGWTLGNWLALESSRAGRCFLLVVLPRLSIELGVMMSSRFVKAALECGRC